MNDKETILSCVINALSTCVDIPIEKIKPDSSLVKDLGLDSFDVVELVMALEEDFGCDIPDTEIEEINGITVAALARIVERHVERTAAP